MLFFFCKSNKSKSASQIRIEVTSNFQTVDHHLSRIKCLGKYLGLRETKLQENRERCVILEKSNLLTKIFGVKRDEIIRNGEILSCSRIK